MRRLLLLAAFALCAIPAHAQTPTGPWPTGYTFCAKEGGTCTFTGTTSVAFGAGSSWVYQTLASPVNCAITANDGPFTDPDVGVVKACFTQAPLQPPTTLTATQTVGNYMLNWTLSPSSAVVGSNGTVTATITVTMTPATTAKVVTLSWTAPAGATGYNVYRSTVNGAAYAKIASVTAVGYQDGTVVSGQGTTYYYVVTSTEGGVESAYSNQASAVVP